MLDVAFWIENWFFKAKCPQDRQGTLQTTQYPR
jgi:hypothetical protein